MLLETYIFKPAAKSAEQLRCTVMLGTSLLVQVAKTSTLP